MNEYQVKFKSSAAKEFRKLPSGIKKRIRIGNYRIVYEIDDSVKLVRITRIRHSKDVYRD